MGTAAYKRKHTIPAKILGLTGKVAIRSQYEVARMLGVSRVSVREVEGRALFKLYMGLVKIRD